MKKTILKTLIAGLMVLTSWAAHANDDDNAMKDLNTVIDNITDIKPYTERGDLGRLIMLQKSTQKVLDSIDANGMANNKTMNAFLEMCISFRYSQAFFIAISSSQTTATIKAIQDTVRKISTERGFDDSPATQVTSNVLNQIARVSDQLMKVDISSNLKQKLNQLKPQLGQAIAVARQGDRPNAFAEGNKIYSAYYQLSPDFDKVMSSKEAFNMVLELQGLMEFYAEFAQISASQGAN